MERRLTRFLGVELESCRYVLIKGQAQGKGGALSLAGFASAGRAETASPSAAVPKRANRRMTDRLSVLLLAHMTLMELQ
jgi:hypothetical protein